jgi:hypothetical protein
MPPSQSRSRDALRKEESDYACTLRREHMTEKIAHHRSKSNWPMHAALVACATAAVSLEHWSPGWGVPVGIGGLVVVLIIHALRRLWHEVWFWVTVAIITLLQGPLMLYVQPYMNQLKLVFIFPFAVLDLLACAIVIQCVAFLCSRDPALR